MTERSWSEMSSEDLALAARGGRLAPFTILVERFEGRLHSFLLRRCGCDADAADLTQETLLRAFRRIDRYDPRWRFSTWLFTIGARLASTHRRAAMRRKGRERAAIGSGESACRAGVSAEPDPAARAAAFDGEGRVWALAREMLTDEQQGLLWLRYAEGLSMREIARVTGRTEVGVRVALFRARDTLAERMDTDGARRDATEGPAAPPSRERAERRAGGAIEAKEMTARLAAGGVQ